MRGTEAIFMGTEGTEAFSWMVLDQCFCFVVFTELGPFREFDQTFLGN